MAGNNELTTRISEFLQQVGKRRLWIQTHDIPDPDAIASAEAFRVLAKQFGVRARIVTNGLSHRKENKILIKECKIHLRLLDSLKIRTASRNAWVFIDCLPGGGNVTLHPLAPGDLFMVFDHHVKSGIVSKQNYHGVFVIDTSAGATATIVGKALIEMDILFPPRLASALSYAIITDTQDFSIPG
ncbi:bifunctional oligoribonuclease/PAP phosphatase NrnA [Candidatus Latescibacterota bacterium]